MIVFFLLFLSVFTKKCYVEDNTSVSEIIRDLSLYGFENQTIIERLSYIITNITYDTNTTNTVVCRGKRFNKYVKYKEVSTVKNLYKIFSKVVQKNLYSFENYTQKIRKKIKKKFKNNKKNNANFWDKISKKITSDYNHNYNDFIHNQKKFKENKHENDTIIDASVYFEYIKNVFSTDTENVKKIDNFLNLFYQNIENIHNFAYKYNNLKNNKNKKFFFESFLNVEDELFTKENGWNGYSKNDITTFDIFSFSDYKNYVLWHYNWLFCLNGFGNSFDCKSCFPYFQTSSYGCKEITFKRQNITLFPDDISVCVDYESFFYYTYIIFSSIYKSVVHYLFSESTVSVFKTIYSSSEKISPLSKENILCLIIYSSNIFIVLIIILALIPLLLATILVCALSEADKRINNEKIDKRDLEGMIKDLIFDTKSEKKKKEISALNYYERFYEKSVK